MFDLLNDDEPTPRKVERDGAIYHYDIAQGTDEWFAARLGMLTASEIDKIITPTLKVANNDKTRAHLWELLAQRLTNYVEPHYVGDEMLRGHNDELAARQVYTKHFAPVEEVGFVTRDMGGFSIGYSPDGLVGDHGLIEIKSRRQKFQVQTLVENVVPDEFVLQIQTGLLVTGRQWCDFISYSGGLPMCPIRVFPDPKVQEAIVDAAAAFEEKLAEKLALCRHRIATDKRLIPTERSVELEMHA